MNKEKKITNEKQISLYPLKFKEALRELLQTTPPPKEKKLQETKKFRKITRTFIWWFQQFSATDEELKSFVCKRTTTKG